MRAMKFGKALVFAIVLPGWIVCGPLGAQAHSFPEQQTPAARQVLPTAPADVSIKYDAQIEKLFANLQVIGPDGKSLAVGAPEVSADGRTLSAKLAPL